MRQQTDKGALIVLGIVSLALVAYVIAGVMEGRAEASDHSTPVMHASDRPMAVRQTLDASLKASIDMETRRELNYDRGTPPADAHESDGEAASDSVPDDGEYLYQNQYSEAGSAPEYSGDGSDFELLGVIHADGRKYTWYSQNVLPGGGLDELNGSGRTVNDRGFVVDGDGYIALAAPNGEEIGTVIDTPMGKAKVYDTNPGGDSYDIYTDW